MPTFQLQVKILYRNGHLSFIDFIKIKFAHSSMVMDMLCQIGKTKNRYFKNCYFIMEQLTIITLTTFSNLKRLQITATGSKKANGREPESCLGQGFNFKLDHFVMHAIARYMQACPSLQLKSQQRFYPVSLSLSILHPVINQTDHNTLLSLFS
jgi:hypothetical protein